MKEKRKETVKRSVKMKINQFEGRSNKAKINLVREQLVKDQ